MTSRQDYILDYTGADNMENVINTFVGKTQQEIEAELDYIFHMDNNAQLAIAISQELAEA